MAFQIIDQTDLTFIVCGCKCTVEKHIYLHEYCTKRYGGGNRPCFRPGEVRSGQERRIGGQEKLLLTGNFSFVGWEGYNRCRRTCWTLLTYRDPVIQSGLLPDCSQVSVWHTCVAWNRLKGLQVKPLENSLKPDNTSYSLIFQNWRLPCGSQLIGCLSSCCTWFFCYHDMAHKSSESQKKSWNIICFSSCNRLHHSPFSWGHHLSALVTVQTLLNRGKVITIRHFTLIHLSFITSLHRIHDNPTFLWNVQEKF